MKRWHVEQILYLNEFNKSKLAVPENHHFNYHAKEIESEKRESVVLNSLRRLLSFFVDTL